MPDLTRVFGERLNVYNSGGLSILYDAYGTNEWRLQPSPDEVDFTPHSTGYPPLCVVRFVQGIGPVSEWMYCSDAYKHACSGTLADRSNAHFLGEPTAPLQQVAGNPKLTPERERLIAYLLHHGHPYQGVGYTDFGVTQAASHLSTGERVALQQLVWCVSDPPAVPDPSDEPGVHEFYAMCEANMGAARQAELLAQIPETPVSQLSLIGLGGPVVAGDVAEFALQTNLFDQPITLSFVEGNGTISVASRNATLSGNQLTVAASATGDASEVLLQVVASEAGHLELQAVATPAATTHLSWNQSPTVNSDGYECQVFAKFDTVASVELATRASTDVTRVPDAAQLAASGWSFDALLAIALATVAGGAMSIVVARRIIRVSGTTD